MLFLICSVLRAYLSSSLFYGERFWERGEEEAGAAEMFSSPSCYKIHSPSETQLGDNRPKAHSGDTETEGMSLSNYIATATSDSELL